MSGEQSLSVSNATSSDVLARSAPERQKPSDRDVAAFERAMRRSDGHVQKRQGGSSQESMQALDKKRLQAQMDVPAMMNALANTQGSVTAPALAEAPLPLDDLITQYVKLLAVSESGATGDARIMLTLDPSLLPQTELFLSRTPEGWVLQANTRSPEAYRVMNEYSSALERRFALRGLGSLSIQTTLQPSALQPIA